MTFPFDYEKHCWEDKHWKCHYCVCAETHLRFFLPRCMGGAVHGLKGCHCTPETAWETYRQSLPTEPTDAHLLSKWGIMHGHDTQRQN